jgi:polyphosphate kinase
VYGFVGLKTHCKTALVVRQEGSQIRRYGHIGTGNYNPKTARAYEDLGLFTADEDVCADLTDLFNVLTGYSRQTTYRSLLVAPQGIRSGLIDRIEREIEHVRAGRHGLIRFKTNHLVDEQAIDALYRASRAGVRVELLVRTFCTIRAGVPGLSENIRCRSITGRFLEHSRVYHFGNDGAPEYWIGSADLMHRNLDRRVEVLCRVTDRQAMAHVAEFLDLAFDDKTAAWELQPDGQWIRSADGGDDYQELLMKRLADRGE